MKDFDWKFYKRAYIDAKNFTKKEAENHFINIGKKQGRIGKRPPIPDNFDWRYYICFNKDLKYLHSEEAAIVHYLNFGIREKRICCSKDYINSNLKYEILGDYKGEFKEILQNEGEALAKATEYFVGMN